MQRVHQPWQKGVGLIEIMVGMVMSLVVMLVIYQIYMTFEAQKRTSTNSAETQENGIFAITTMEREIRMAGWGIANPALLACTTLHTYYAPNNSGNKGNGNANGGNSGGPIANFSMMPVKIIDGGTGPDTITLLSGTSMAVNAKNSVIQVIGSGTGTEFIPEFKVGLNVGDMVWMVNGGQCTLSQITAQNGNSGHAQRAPGGSQFNPDNSYKNAAGWPNETGWTLYNLGAMTQRTYSISANTLQFADLAGQGAMGLVSNIVSIKAYYGVSAAPGKQNVVNWVPATGNWSTPNVNDVRRIKAVRLAVIARSPLLEKPASNGTCSITTTPPMTWNGGPAIDFSADPNWRCYRYKTFQTIIPLRNVLWADL